MKNTRNQDNIIYLLRICTCLLAAVSFWSTAQGMIDYTFPRSWQAYAASLGIQGLLLGLNFSLPSFLRQCNNGVQKLVLYLLTTVVLFCSSWFSYLFIAKQAYGESWNTERRLLAQSIYRDELFKSDIYLQSYSQELQGVLMDQVIDLYQQALNKDENNVDVSENLNWDEELNKYAGNESSAKDIMTTVISAMESATSEGATQDVREQAVSVLSGMQSNLQSEIGNLSTQITNMDTRVASSESALRNAETRLARAPEGVDLTQYQDTVNRAANTYNNLITRQNALEAQRNDYEIALQRVTYYMAILGMAENGVSSYFVGTNLREIQRELFQSSPDTIKMLNLATEIFDRLQDSVDMGNNAPEYQNILTSMNGFIQNLEKYSALRETNNTIQLQINELSEGNILSLEKDEELSNWRDQFNNLKSNISGLPVYTLQNQSGMDTFDRTTSVNNLDLAIRRYLTEHNAAQAGLIYLLSPYREVAIFSLFLALLLDIAAFITGVIIDRTSTNNRTGGDIFSSITNPDSNNFIENTDNRIWSIDLGLNRYIFLTGDYTSVDGVITYRAIENGEQIEFPYSKPDMPVGLYQWNNNQLCTLQLSTLLFKKVSGGPQDGVYSDCILHCEDHLLTMTQNGKTNFLGAVGFNVPVYLLSNEHFDAISSENISDTYAQMVIVALNKEGSRIIAIYAIEK